MDNLVGQRLLGRYRVDTFVGQGGMARVYKAWDSRRSYYVAIKVLKKDLTQEPDLMQRFRDEAHLLRELRHPHIVRYYDFEEQGSVAFLVIDYVGGESLRSKLAAIEKPLSLGQTLSILKPICTALNYAHEENVIHCDVKPANILIDNDGKALLSDFGIAYWAQQVTHGQPSAGSPAYMAPEQCTGDPLDRRTDVYALGLTTYEMLTLDRAFRGDTTDSPGSTAERIRWEQVHRPPPKPVERNRAITPETQNVILRALAKRPEQRQPDAMTFLGELSSGGQVQPEDMTQWPGRTVTPVGPAHPPRVEPRPEPTQPPQKPSVWERWGFKPPSVQPHPRGGQLQVMRGEAPGYVYAIGAEGISIGRGRDNQVRLGQRSVSRRHACIRYGNGRFYLQDQGSMHGTFVNGQRIQAIALNDGDMIQIGDTEFVFRFVY